MPYVMVDGGVSFANNAGVTDDNPNSADCVLQPAAGTTCTGALNDLGGGPNLGVAAGLVLPHGFSADFSYVYRGGFKLNGRDEGATDFDSRVTSHAFMINGHYVVPVMITNFNVQPFVSAGVGASRNKLATLHWNDGTTQGVLPGGSNTSFAWMLGAGARAPIPGVKGLHAMAGYRYVDLGDIKKDFGRDISGAGFSASGNTGAMTGDLTAHEIFFGLIYEFGRPLPREPHVIAARRAGASPAVGPLDGAFI